MPTNLIESWKRSESLIITGVVEDITALKRIVRRSDGKGNTPCCLPDRKEK